MNTSNRHRARIFFILAIFAFGIVHLLFQISPGIFETWNSQVFDRFFLIRSSIPEFRPPYDKTVVHVDLNDTAIQQLKTFYLTRSHYAEVIRNLAAMGTAAQVYDFIFAAGTSQAEDQAIIGAAAEAGNVYFGMSFAFLPQAKTRPDRTAPEVAEYLDRTQWKVKTTGDIDELYSGAKPFVTFPPLAGAAKGIGFLTLQNDRDGVTRRAPLLVRYGDGFYPSLPFRVACDYLGVPPERITLEPGRFIRLEGARRPDWKTARDVLIPIDERGEMIVNFIGPWESMSHRNFAQIMAASGDHEGLEMWSEVLSGKIVVISDVSTGATDLGPVPVDISFPLAGLHANVLQTILSGNFLYEVTGPRMSAIELCLVFLIFLVSLRLSPVYFIGGSILMIVGYALSALLLFLTQGLLIQIVRPVISAGTAALLITVHRYFQDEKENEVLRRSFESYFPPTVVKKIIANPALINRGQRKELTILFSDIKDFTTYSSTLSPDRIRGFLNEYFETMVDVVFQHSGTVDKYIGDGLMVFFGDPEPLPDHASRAVRAAVAMRQKAAELSRKWQQEGRFPLQIRIGINTGEVVVGNMGSSRRLSYTVLGSAVNLAKRLESNAPVNGILMSERTYRLIEADTPTRFYGSIQVKGIAEPVSTYEVTPGGAGVASSKQ